MADKQARTARPAVSEGMEAARARGVRLGRPPADVPASAARAAELRDASMSLAQIAAALNAEGVPTPRGAGAWQKSSVAYVLRRWDETRAS